MTNTPPPADPPSDDGHTPHEDASSQPTSSLLEQVVTRHQSDYISFGEIMASLHERGFAVLMAIFVLPNCVPIPIPPGFSTILSIPILFLSAQMIGMRDSPWLPAWLHRKKMKRATLALIIETVSPRLKRLEKVLRPRFFYSDVSTVEKFVGVVSLLFGISIAVPLPMTNFLPGVGILVMSLGLLSRDGLFILIGILVGMAGVTFTTLLLLLGKAAVFGLMGVSHTLVE